MNLKQRIVVTNSKAGQMITPAHRMQFMANCSFCENCTTSDILKALKEYIKETSL